MHASRNYMKLLVAESASSASSAAKHSASSAAGPAALAVIAAALLLAPVHAQQNGRAGAAKPDVLFIPTPQPVVEAMLELADVKKTDVVYDLGSGDGRIVITAAKKYGARGVGIELDPALVKQARQNAAAARVADRVRFVTQDLFTTELRPA